jgi:hypothetical protein
MTEGSIFTGDKKVQLDLDYSQVVAKGVAATSVMGTVRINKKFVKKATVEQLAVVVVQWVVQGAKQKSIIKSLVKQGVSSEFATELAEKVKLAVDDYKKTPEGMKVLSRKYRNQMITGFVWFVIGMAITIGTFMAASGGGTYFIAYGAIIWGIIGLIIGLIGWVKYKRGAR